MARPKPKSKYWKSRVKISKEDKSEWNVLLGEAWRNNNDLRKEETINVFPKQQNKINLSEMFYGMEDMYTRSFCLNIMLKQQRLPLYGFRNREQCLAWFDGNLKLMDSIFDCGHFNLVNYKVNSNGVCHGIYQTVFDAFEIQEGFVAPKNIALNVWGPIVRCKKQPQPIEQQNS